jgi:hypothetical protein
MTRMPHRLLRPWHRKLKLAQLLIDDWPSFVAHLTLGALPGLMGAASMKNPMRKSDQEHILCDAKHSRLSLDPTDPLTL